MTLKRIAIILEKNLSIGEVGNVAAILMGQAVQLRPEIYVTPPPMDTQGNCHAAIQYSTVVLKAGQGQIVNLAAKLQMEGALQPEGAGLTYAVFSRSGQSLHNAYPEYKARVESSALADLEPVGIVVIGDDEQVRQATKKFSMLK